MKQIEQVLEFFFYNCSAPLTLLALLVWGYFLHRSYGNAITAWLKKEKLAVAISLAAAASIFLSTWVGYKVLSDETNLLSVANMLTLFGKASNTQEIVYYYHAYHPLDYSVPTRPILFPVLVALLQQVVGVRDWAPFAINFALTITLFLLTFAWARKRLPRLPAVPLALLALLMSPVLSLTATSAGYDLCSLVIGLALFLLWQERAKQGPAVILLGLVCFASVRYESLAALGIFGLALLLSQPKFFFRQPLLLFGLGVFVAPLLVQRVLTFGQFENPDGVAPFSLTHLREHLPAFLKAFFLEPRGPYPILLHWVGLAGLLLTLKRKRGLDLLPVAYFAFLLLLLLSHHFGWAAHPTQARLFLPLSFALSLAALAFLSDIRPWVEPRALLAAFVLLFFHHQQYVKADPLLSQLSMTREMRHLRELLAAQAKKEDLFVYDHPGQLAAFGWSAISRREFDRAEGDYLRSLRKGLYQRILLVERLSYKAETEAHSFQLKPLYKQQLGPDTYLQVSQIELL